MTPGSTIAPGAHLQLRDAVWRVVRVDPTSNGAQAWRCIGVSEIVRDEEAVFLEELEPDVEVLDPRVTQAGSGASTMTLSRKWVGPCRHLRFLSSQPGTTACWKCG